MTALDGWENFYVILGSSAGALIGLQFVVITLVAGMRQPSGTDTVNAFGTPTVVHLSMTLVIAAIMSAPWPSLSGPSTLLLLCGLGGLVYEVIVIRRARRQTLYQPVREDWFWYMILPSAMYAAIAIAALFLRRAFRGDAFVAGAAALGLLLVAIRNAWDTVLHVVVSTSGDDAPQAG